MTKRLEAKVVRVLQNGIHTCVRPTPNGEAASEPLPLADRVEIELDGDPSDPCMMYRYLTDGTFCGDTWHENLAVAMQQAMFEYGLTEEDFKETPL